MLLGTADLGLLIHTPRVSTSDICKFLNLGLLLKTTERLQIVISHFVISISIKPSDD